MQNTLPLNTNQERTKRHALCFGGNQDCRSDLPEVHTIVPDRSRASLITTSLGQLKASTERKATGHTSMPRNQYFGTKMPLAQQALEMLPSNTRDEGKAA
jgi:hypothetical protein